MIKKNIYQKKNLKSKMSNNNINNNYEKFIFNKIINKTKNKKSISVVITTVLLLLVAVIFLSYYYIWGNSYFTKESATLFATKQDLHIFKLQNNILYITNYNNENYPISKIRVNDYLCNVSYNVIIPGLNKLNLSNCSIYRGENVEILIKGDKFVLLKDLTNQY